MNKHPSTERATDVLEGEEFYEMCQSYRTSEEWYPHGMTPTLRFEALKNWIREHCIVPAEVQR